MLKSLVFKGNIFLFSFPNITIFSEHGPKKLKPLSPLLSAKLAGDFWELFKSVFLRKYAKQGICKSSDFAKNRKAETL